MVVHLRHQKGDGNAMTDDPLRSTKLVLVVGSGRSGTTWLGKIFDSHPTTLYYHEPGRHFSHWRIPSLVLEEHVAEYMETFTKVVAALPYVHNPDVLYKSPLFTKNCHSFVGNRCRHLIGWMAKGEHRVLGTSRIGQLFRRANRHYGPLVWKSVSDVGRINLFLSLLEQAVVVHIVRHPCGVLASRIRADGHGFRSLAEATSAGMIREIGQLLQTPFATGLPLTQQDLPALSPLERYSVRWAIMNAKALHDVNDSRRATTVLYEDLCADPFAVSRRLYELAGLDWNRQTDSFLAKSISRHTNGHFSLRKDPSVTSNRWRETLSLEQQKQIVSLVGDSLPGRLYSRSQAGKQMSIG